MTPTITLLESFAAAHLADAAILTASIAELETDLADARTEYAAWKATYLLQAARDELERHRELAARDLETVSKLKQRQRVHGRN